jgi:hypothetical protein
MFSLYDPFDQHEITGLKVVTDDDRIVTSWSMPGEGSHDVEELQSDDVERNETGIGIQTMSRARPRLPPFLFLPLPFPFTYVSPTILLLR